MKAIVNLSREETLKARYNQPRISFEELRQQEEEHKRTSEELFMAVKKETLKSGPRSRLLAECRPCPSWF
jgi:hypothetical protein